MHRLAARAGLPADQARQLGPRMIRRSAMAADSTHGLADIPG